jgi:hypothetical protein
MDARSKLVAERGLTKQKIILRWFVNFHQMTISLPENKCLVHLKVISEMLQWGWTSHRELETNLGPWVHLGQIIPIVAVGRWAYQAKEEEQINVVLFVA